MGICLSVTEAEKYATQRCHPRLPTHHGGPPTQVLSLLTLEFEALHGAQGLGWQDGVGFGRDNALTTPWDGCVFLGVSNC